jgi:hypothetical protein
MQRARFGEISQGERPPGPVDRLMNRRLVDEPTTAFFAATSVITSPTAQAQEQQAGVTGEARPERGGALQGVLDELVAENGVIDADELASLPDGNPLANPDGPFAAAAADGEITQQEIQDVLEQLRGERREGGPRLGGDVPDVEGASV